MDFEEDEFLEADLLNDYDKHKDPNYLQIVQAFKEGLPICIYSHDNAKIGDTIIINGIPIDLLDYGFTLLIFAKTSDGSDFFPTKESFNYMDVYKTIYPISDPQFDRKLHESEVQLVLNNEYLRKFSFIDTFNEFIKDNQVKAKVSDSKLKRLKK